ncbi:MAG TPA: hypothetical protein VMV29_06785 [Ktedonobacterales bacterium]|nr:hypothetical protein [Ktedonobacterales bacterium]
MPDSAQAPQVATPTRVAQAWIAGLSLLIVVLAGVGTIASIFTASESHHRTFTTLRGELISIRGGGL